MSEVLVMHTRSCNNHLNFENWLSRLRDIKKKLKIRLLEEASNSIT